MSSRPSTRRPKNKSPQRSPHSSTQPPAWQISPGVGDGRRRRRPASETASVGDGQRRRRSRVIARPPVRCTCPFDAVHVMDRRQEVHRTDGTCNAPGITKPEEPRSPPFGSPSQARHAGGTSPRGSRSQNKKSRGSTPRLSVTRSGEPGVAPNPWLSVKRRRRDTNIQHGP